MSRATNLDPASTRTLLREALGGDPEAERRFFDGVKNRLVGLARSHPMMGRLRGTTTPEDVASEVLVRCLSAGAFERFEHRGRDSLGRYLQVVLQRTLVDMLRRSTSAKRRSRTRPEVALELLGPGGDATWEPQANDPTPTSSARTSELAGLCEHLLSGRELEVWRLVEFEGWAPVEAAARLGLAPSTVRSLFHRARCKLIRALDPTDEAEA